MRQITGAALLAIGVLGVGAGAAHAQDQPACFGQGLKTTPQPITKSTVDRFLGSLGVNTHIDQGIDPNSYILPLRYMGIKNVRDGSRNAAGMIMVARATGARLAVIAGGNMDVFLAAARALARTGALLAIEGPNEPNNFPITYKDRKGGGTFGWSVVAEYQRDLWNRSKQDPILSRYPIFAPSEVGAESENVGLQFLKIPSNAGTLFPDGTSFADYANVHNYVSGVHGGYDDNQAWNAADPILRGRWDGLAGNNGTTWKGKFKGYSDLDLNSLPRVTTETGYDAGTDKTEQRTQGVVLVNNYLAQFARGWAYTFIYELRDNEGGSSKQGLYIADQPKAAANYIHNLTSSLSDPPVKNASFLTTEASFSTDSSTVHAMDLAKMNGHRAMIVWGERVSGTDVASIEFSVKTKVSIFDVTRGTDPIETSENVTQQCLKITDHAVIVDYQAVEN